MLKKIFSYGFVEGFAKGLNKLTLLVLPFFLSTIDYGKVGLLVSVEMIIPLISLLGFERAVLRFYSNKQDYSGFNKTVFSSVLWSHLLLLLILSLVYLFGGRTFFGLNIFPDLFLIVALIYFQGTNLITLNMLRVNENHRTYFRGRIYIQLTKFILVIICVYIMNSYLGYVVGSLIGAIISNFIYTAGSRKTEAKENFNKNTFTSLFVFSWPFIFHGVAGNLLGNADKFILERFLTLNDVGLYTLAYSLGSSMIFAYIGISVFMEPMIYKENDEEKRKVLLDKFILATLSFGIIAYAIIAIASLYILPVFYHEKYNEVFKYTPLIAVSFLIYPFYLKSNYKMIYEKKSLNIAVVSIISSIVNIALNIYLVPIYGIYAAVLTTLISYVLQAIMFVLIANKFRLNQDLGQVIILSLILCVSIFYKLDYYYLVTTVILYIGCLFFFNLKRNIKFL